MQSVTRQSKARSACVNSNLQKVATKMTESWTSAIVIFQPGNAPSFRKSLVPQQIKTSFRKDPELQTLSIIGTIHCGNNKPVRATVVMKPKRRVEDIIKSQTYNSKKPGSSLLEAQTKEPNTVFLRIIPDPSMGPSCSKTVEAKLGMREFKVKGDKGVFDVGKCDLSVGKCTKFPFPV
jgi:hypothetical protein